MAVPDVPEELILNERTSYDQYLWLLPGVVYYRWDSRVQYMYGVGATPVEGQGLPAKPPVPPIDSPFDNGQNDYLDGTFVKSVNNTKPDELGNVSINGVGSYDTQTGLYSPDAGSSSIPTVDPQTGRFSSFVINGLSRDFSSKYVSAATKAATAPLLGRLKRNVQDATILAIGDSTGNEAVEHFYLELVDLGARFPSYTILYSLWNDATGAYDAAVTVQAGTGTQVLRFYNCSVSGKAPGYIMGSRWNTAIAALPSVDLAFISHGHNMGDPSPNGNGKSSVRWSYLQLTEELAIQHPGAGIVLMSQNPTYLAGRETWQAKKAQILQGIASQRGYGFIDVHQAFQDTGNPQAYVKSDLIHPTTVNDGLLTNGSRLWADLVGVSLTYDREAATLPRSRSSLLDGSSSIANVSPSFSTWGAGLPDGVTPTNATVTKDSTNFETGTFAMRITTGVSDGAAYVDIAGGANSFDKKSQVAGRDVTVAVRMFVPSSYIGTPSVVILDSAGSTQQARVDVPTDQRDRFFWVVAVKRVNTDGKFLRVQIAPRLSGSASGYIVVDRFSLVEGDLPRDAIFAAPSSNTTPGQFDHLSTVGTNPALTNLAAGGGTMGPNAANQGIGKKIKPFRDVSVAYLDWISGASSGNYDIGIYDASTGAKVWTKGTSAWPASSATQTEAVGSTALLKDKEYWVVMSADNTTGKMRGVVGNIAALKHLDGTNDTFVANGMFPLPDTLPSTSVGVAYFPVVVIREA